MKFGFLRAGALLAAAVCCVPTYGDELAEKGRAVLAASKASVVTVRIVIKQQWSMPQFGSHEEEMKSEATGTVIDPSGLTVLSLNATDPTSFIEDMMSEGDREGFEMKSSISDLKILLTDGTEIPAQVVLRDRDLDLAFVRPTEAPKDPVAALDLAKAATPAVLDPIVTLNRLGKVASREYAVSIERISAIVSRPRTFFVMGNDPTQTELGCPALNVDGNIIGICVLRTVKGGGESAGMMGMMGGASNNMLAIVIPAADVLEVAKQAPQAGEAAKELGAPPAPEKKEEPKKEEEKPAEGQPAEKPKEGTDGTIELKPADAPK